MVFELYYVYVSEKLQKNYIVEVVVMENLISLLSPHQSEHI